MAIRAAAIWGAVSQPGSSAWIPKSPRAPDVPPLAAPDSRPRCVLRCLTFLGINMSVRLLAEVRRLVMLVAVLSFHLLVLGQLALQVVGLSRRRQQVGRRRRLGLLVGLDLGGGRVRGNGGVGAGVGTGVGAGLGVGVCVCVEIGLGDHGRLGGLGHLLFDGLFLHGAICCAVVVGGEVLGAAAGAPRGGGAGRAHL